MLLTLEHRVELHCSGLSDETITAAGFLSVSAEEASALLGFRVESAGWAIPYDDEGSYHRVKLDTPGPDGKRYRSPRGRGNRLYLPPSLDPAVLKDPTIPLYITEGEKKALCSMQEGIPCVALAGVWAWMQKKADGITSEPISDLDQIAWAGRLVNVVFDSDLVSNSLVATAERALGTYLATRGAHPYAIHLPAGLNGAKVGLDDLLVEHGVGALVTLDAVPIHPTNAAEDTISAPDEPVTFTVLDGGDDWDDVQDIEFLIDTLLPTVGIVWWGGLPKRFKSLLLLYLCLAIACRRPDVMRKFRIRRDVLPRILYVAREDPISRVKARRDDILSAWGMRPPPGAIKFLIKQRLDLRNPKHVVWITARCHEFGATILVLDTWTALSPTADPLGTKDQTELSEIIRQLQENIGETGIGGLVIVVDHSRKNRPDGQPLSSADIFGPTQKWQAAEHIVMQDVVISNRRIEVFVEGKDGDTIRFFVNVSPRGSGEEKFTWGGDVEVMAETSRRTGLSNRDAILSEAHQLIDAGKEATVDTVHAAHVDRATAGGFKPLTRGSVKDHLRDLLKKGQLSSPILQARGQARTYLRPPDPDAGLPAEERERKRRQRVIDLLTRRPS